MLLGRPRASLRGDLRRPWGTGGAGPEGEAGAVGWVSFNLVAASSAWTTCRRSAENAHALVDYYVDSRNSRFDLRSLPPCARSSCSSLLARAMAFEQSSAFDKAADISRHSKARHSPKNAAL